MGLSVYVYSQGQIELSPLVLRERIAAFGWLAPAGFAAAAALRPFLLLPSWIVMSAGGLLFGVAGGVFWGSIGFTIGALFSFGVARGLGRDLVARRMHGRVERFDGYLRRQGARWMAIYTAIPVTPLTPVHAAAGLSAMSLLAFGAAVFIGFLPRLVLYSFFGNSLARGDVREMVVGASVLGVAVVAGTLVARRFMQRSEGAPPDSSESKLSG